MERAGVFVSNRSQAVRIPKVLALPASIKQVDIIPLGRALLITPAGDAWASWFEAEGVSEDFMCDREQPAEQERESF